jgi:hypothetical protein
MSYVLHIWEMPDAASWPSSAAEARQLLSQLSAVQLGQNPKFLTLAAKLTERYPCICLPEADDIAEDEWAWSDGPLDGKTNSAKYSIGLNTGMLDEVRPFVLQEAKELGLNVADDQAGETQLANGTLLSANAVEPKASHAPASKYDDVPTRRELEQAVFERLVPFMESRGYKAKKSDHSFKCSFPGGWHQITLFTEDRWPLHCRFKLLVASRFDAVTDLAVAVGMPHLSPKESKHQRTTVVDNAKWLNSTAEFIHADNKEYVVAKKTELENVLKHFFAQLENRLFPILEKYQTIEGLDELLNPDPVTGSMFFTSHENGSANVIAAYLAHNPRLAQLCDEFSSKTAHMKPDPYLVGSLRLCIDYIKAHPVST